MGKLPQILGITEKIIEMDAITTILHFYEEESTSLTTFRSSINYCNVK